jgi:type VI secretion system protein ImpF
MSFARTTDAPARAQLPLLDRLIDDAPDRADAAPLSGAEAIAALRRSVRRDLEALLNARRRWRSWPAHLTELRTSPLGYGLPDFTAGAFDEAATRERFRAEVEDTIRRFEPRLAELSVHLADAGAARTLHLRIEAALHADPAPEPVAFETIVDPVSTAISLREAANV